MVYVETPQYARGPERDIGTTLQQFIDNRIVSEVKNITRIRHTPAKHPSNPLLSQDKPWERDVQFRTSNYSVIFDEELNEFRCYYEDIDPPRRDDPASPFDRMAGRARARVLFARSEDGVNWDKPELDIHPYEARGTNILFGEGVHSASVLYDAEEANSEARYKMVYTGTKMGVNEHKDYRWPSPHSSGMHLATSPDGLNWTDHPGNPVAAAASDVQVLTYDPDEGVYVVMGRGLGWGGGNHPNLDKFFPAHRPDTPPGALAPKRIVTRIESADAVNWSNPEIVMAPDDTDNLDDEHYGLVQWRRGEHYLGLLSKIHTVANTVEMELVASDDGKKWRRFAHRPPVIPLGEEGAADQFMVECPTPPVIRGDHQYIFYGGSSRHHDFSWQPPDDVDPGELQLAGKSHLFLATIRKEGWFSLTALEREGYVETVPVFSTGKKLVVNAQCDRGGYLICELRDAWGNVWSEFDRDSCDTFTGDSTHHVVSWAGNTEAALAPGFLQIRFYLRRANLYSFHFTNE